MRTKLLVTVATLVGVAILGATLIQRARGGAPKSIDPLDAAQVECTAVEKGVTYKLSHGDLYRVNQGTGKWEFMGRWYDPDFYKINYVQRDGAIFRKTQDGQLIALKRQFAEDFEGATSIHDLIGMQRGWTDFTLQSPRTPTVNDYVALRHRILEGKSDFIDNRVEVSQDVVHGGRAALKTYCMPPSSGMICAKSFLGTDLLHFVKGDDVWLSSWFYVPKGSGMPFTVLDLKTTWIKQYPGMRVVISGGKYACYELKWANHVMHHQPRGKEVPFPQGQWAHLNAHLKLSDTEDGIIELWQDGAKIIEDRGQTLPLANTVYDRLEVGITAHDDRSNAATLYVDDVGVSDHPLETSH